MDADFAARPASAGALFDIIAVATKVATAMMLVMLVCGEAFLRSAFHYSVGFLPFFAIILIFMLLLIAFPQIALFLPSITLG